jgi:CRISPR-associated Csx3 family protein
MVTLTNVQLSEIIGKEPGSNGKVYWEPSELLQVKIALRALRLTTQEDSFVIDSVMPYWLYLAIAAVLAPKSVVLNTPNFGQILIPTNKLNNGGSGLTFNTFESEDFTLVQFSSPRNMLPDQLKNIEPPTVNLKKGVVISSNAPPWIIVTVGLAYANAAAWVACTQKVGNPVVAISNDKATPLGTELDNQKVQQTIQEAAQSAVPKRGEVWVFDDGYGEHPGIIFSPESRNKSWDDVLLVPLTTSLRHAHRHLRVARADTGLTIDCYAQCANVSRVAKEQILKGPISVVRPDLMERILLNVRQALGDVA